MEEDLTGFMQGQLAHWPFVAWLIVSMLIGQVMKNTLWTKEHAINSKPHWFWWWSYKTMVLHALVVGLFVGLVWQHPEEGVDGLPASMGYFALSGALSTWAYELLKNLIKTKTGVELSMPGLSEPPKPVQIDVVVLADRSKEPEE